VFLDEFTFVELVDQCSFANICVTDNYHLQVVFSSGQLLCFNFGARGVCVGMGSSISEELAGTTTLVLFHIGVPRPFNAIKHFDVVFGFRLLQQILVVVLGGTFGTPSHHRNLFFLFNWRHCRTRPRDSPLCRLSPLQDLRGCDLFFLALLQSNLLILYGFCQFCNN